MNSGDLLKGQASVEILIMMALLLLVFTIAVYIYSNYTIEAGQMKTTLEANRICNEVSGILGSLAATSGNSTYKLTLPDAIDYQDYTIWIVANSNVVRVDYANSGVGCKLQTRAITKNSQTTFQLDKNATIKSNGGVLTVQ